MNAPQLSSRQRGNPPKVAKLKKGAQRFWGIAVEGNLVLFAMRRRVFEKRRKEWRGEGKDFRGDPEMERSGPGRYDRDDQEIASGINIDGLWRLRRLGRLGIAWNRHDETISSF